MNRTMTVKTLFLLLVMWMPLAVPCHAAWDDYEDDFNNYWNDGCDDYVWLPAIEVIGTAPSDYSDWDDDSDDEDTNMDSSGKTESASSDNDNSYNDSGDYGWIDDGNSDDDDGWSDNDDSNSYRDDDGWPNNDDGSSDNDGWPDNDNGYEGEDSSNGLYDDIEDSGTMREYSVEEEIEWAKSFSTRLRKLLNQFEKENRLKVVASFNISSTVSIPVKNPKYDPVSKCILIPLNDNFTASGVVHEFIHVAQDENGMLKIACGSDNEYQAYVLNFILQRAVGIIEGAPKGMAATKIWKDFQNLLNKEENNCGIDDGVIWINQFLLDELKKLDHQSLSELFREYYETFAPNLDVYWKYHDPNYQWNWEKLFEYFGVKIKK